MVSRGLRLILAGFRILDLLGTNEMRRPPQLDRASSADRREVSVQDLGPVLFRLAA